ncbi:MAG: NifU family protein [Anaerolineales bacterium]|jgi:Fe/S biogenesis protein NfuA
MTDKTENGKVLEITPGAVDKIAELIATRAKGPQAIRVVLRGRGPDGNLMSDFMFVEMGSNEETDVVQDAGPFPLYFDVNSAEGLDGATVDYNELKYPTGFGIEYPPQAAQVAMKPTKEWDDPAAVEVQKVIDQQLNPAIAGHGGWVRLLEVKDETAYIEMGGGCRGCAISQMTLKDSIERAILDNVPEIKKVVDTTDHDGGTNPYYTQASGATPAIPGKSPLSEE